MTLQLPLVGVVAAINLCGQLIELIVLDRDRRLKVSTRTGKLRRHAILHSVGRLIERRIQIWIGVQIRAIRCVGFVIGRRIECRIAIRPKLSGIAQVLVLNAIEVRHLLARVILRATLVVECLSLTNAELIGVIKPIGKLGLGGLGNVGRTAAAHDYLVRIRVLPPEAESTHGICIGAPSGRTMGEACTGGGCIIGACTGDGGG